MKLIDMKQESKPEIETGSLPEESPPYPYGLQLNFHKAEIDKIPNLRDMEAGTMVKITGIGKITENTTTTISIDSTPEGKKVEQRHSVTIQVQEIGVVDKNNAEESFFEATEELRWQKYPR